MVRIGGARITIEIMGIVIVSRNGTSLVLRLGSTLGISRNALASGFFAKTVG